MHRTVPEAHSELLHYTNAAGLLGILESQSIRATHSAFLNDSTEIALFFEQRLAKIVESAIRRELAADPKLQVLPQFAKTPEEAEVVIGRYVMDMTDAIRTTTQRLNEPYLVCFSTPANKRIRTDGLLSQWRGYGKDGGYAIVFDSQKLEDALKCEGNFFWYQHLHWGDAHYYQDDDDLRSGEPEISAAEDVLRDCIGKFINNPEPSELEPTFEPMAKLSCLYKHWGFHEEREVRIAAIPPNAELLRDGRMAGEIRPVRDCETFLRGGTPVPYLDLLAHPKGDAFRLPILRIIIGPHPQSQLRCAAVKKVLRASGLEAEVVISKIPYVGG